MAEPPPDSPGALWDQRYAGTAWPSDPDAALVELAGPLPPGRADDLGCGPGRNAIWLATRGWSVTGVDASAVGLRQAAERAAAAGVELELVQDDIVTYPVEGVDLIVVANLHFAPGERERWFERLGRGLAPGGHLYVKGHHLDSLGRVGPSDPERLYTEALLADLLAGLEATVWRRERPAGDGGDPLVDVVAWATPRTSNPEEGR